MSNIAPSPARKDVGWPGDETEDHLRDARVDTIRSWSSLMRWAPKTAGLIMSRDMIPRRRRASVDITHTAS
jgi:hypothetical protein